MINKTLAKLEAEIREAAGSDDARRDELLELVAEVRSELGTAAETQPAEALALAQHTHAAASTARAAPVEDEEDDDSLEDAFVEFEANHPSAVGLVRRFLQTLADAGI